MSDLPIAKYSIHWCVNYPEKAAERIAKLEAKKKNWETVASWVPANRVLVDENNELKERIAELEAEVARLNGELRKRGEWHHPACRKMMYDIGSSPCTCELEFERSLMDLNNASRKTVSAEAALKRVQNDLQDILTDYNLLTPAKVREQLEDTINELVAALKEGGK